MYAGVYYAQSGYAMPGEVLTEPEAEVIVYHTTPIVLGDNILALATEPEEDTTIYLEA